MLCLAVTARAQKASDPVIYDLWRFEGGAGGGLSQ